MKRTIIEAKEIDTTPDLYSGYKVLNMYRLANAIPASPRDRKIDIYGFFLADLDMRQPKAVSNEVYFPILFTSIEHAQALFERIDSHQTIDDIIGSPKNPLKGLLSAT